MSEISYDSEIDFSIVKKPQPFLKWAGGKRQLLSNLLKEIPSDYKARRYIEPFLGGGALFFELTPNESILSDLNEDLINCYNVVKESPFELINSLKDYKINESFYYKVRDKWDLSSLDNIEKASRLFYLNRTCFNGLYRVNRKGEFNVPWGKKNKNNKIYDEGIILSAHQTLQSSKIICGDYKDVIRENVQSGDIIFFDPPYYKSGGYSDFNRYTITPFYEEDHSELRDLFIELDEMGCLVILTNSDTIFVRDLYSRYTIKSITTKRNISSKSSTRIGKDVLIKSEKTKTIPQLIYEGHKDLLQGFPGTRYMGSKLRIIPFIFDTVKNLKFDTVLDAFSGSSCVSYMFKQIGKEVYSNDFMNFSFLFSKSTVENQNVLLSVDDLKKLLERNNKSTFISDTFQGLYFDDDDNQFLDSLRCNIENIKNEYKKSIALSSISRACLKKRARGVFTYVGLRYQDGRKDLQKSLKQHFIENVMMFNKSVFDNGKKCQSFNMDIFNLEIPPPDLIYLDPPYFSPLSDNDYTRRYHFIEGLVKNWDGLEIIQSTKTKKFKKYDSEFGSKIKTYDAFENLFKQYKDSIIVLSYSSNSLPTKNELVDMMKKYKKDVKVFERKLTYSFGTHSNLKTNMSNRVKEYLFVGK